MMHYLNKDIVLQALYEHIRAHFESAINVENCQGIKEACDALVDMDDDDGKHQETLQSLNISDEEKDKLITAVCTQLSQEYPSQLDSKKTSFIQNMIERFNIATLMKGDFNGFYSDAGLKGLLKNKIEQKHKTQTPGKITLNPSSFFVSQEASQTYDSEQSDVPEVLHSR